jgi:hypothetical protein
VQTMAEFFSSSKQVNRDYRNSNSLKKNCFKRSQMAYQQYVNDKNTHFFLENNIKNM